MKVLLFFVLAVFCHTSFASPAGTIIYVDINANPGGNGRTPARAFKYLQDGLDAAEGFKTPVDIYVAKGTYYPDEGSTVTNGDRAAAFTMLNNVRILGGYDSGFPLTSGRNWTLYKTILSGDINQNNTNRSHQVIRNEYTQSIRLTSSSVLNGFIIEKSDGYFHHGGGLVNSYASPRIEYCIFRDNEANFGAANYNYFSEPVFENCLFYDNQSVFGGNTIYNENSILNLINCTVTNNFAGGSSNTESIKSEGSTLFITNTILWNNSEELVDVFPISTNSYQVTYSDIEGGFTGIGNINSDPLFADPTLHDYSLKICSPVFNKGTNSASTQNSDLLGAIRIRYDQIDMGAIEYVTGVIFVDADAQGSNDGSSWSNAFIYLQDALTLLRDCEGAGQIWVAEGDYYPDDGILHFNNFRGESFEMLNNVGLYGGFLGNETTLGQRNYSNNITTLHGDLEQNDHLGDLSGNSYHVIRNNYSAAIPLNSSAILDGFSVVRGWSRWNNINVFGGGIYNHYASPTIRNCRINQNYAIFGGGIYNEHSSPIIQNCSFTDNEAENKGGAIFFNDSDVIITNATFITNKATNVDPNGLGRDGGAFAASLSFGNVSNSSFFNNEADIGGGAIVLTAGTGINFNNCTFNANKAEKGGAILISTGESPTPLVGDTGFTNCVFTDNYSAFDEAIVDPGHYGGAIYVQYGTVTIDECNFENNITENYGGAIYFFKGASTVTNSTFTENWAIYLDGDPSIVTPGGGALAIGKAAFVDVSHCEFYNNQGRDVGGGIYSLSDHFRLENCLLVDNEAFIGVGGALEMEDSDPEIVNCTLVNKTKITTAIVASNNANPIFANNIVYGDALAAQFYLVGNSDPVVQHCIIEGGYPISPTVWDENPRFSSPNNGDYTLQKCSPAIDIGLNGLTSSVIDLAGNPRVYNAKEDTTVNVDLGAYEYNDLFQTNCDCPLDMILTGNVASAIYKSQESIKSQSIVQSGERLRLGTNGSITLTPPFETQYNSVFEAKMEGCEHK